MQPANVNEWLAVANSRAADAAAVHLSDANSVGGFYLVGYAIECSLKAYLLAGRQNFAVRGSAGHDLQGLWKASGFLLRDLRDSDGCKAFFVQSWNTSYRYSASVAGPQPNALLLQRAKELSGWIQTRIRRKIYKK